MNPAEAIGLNPRTAAKPASGTATAPEAASWLQPPNPIQAARPPPPATHPAVGQPARVDRPALRQQREPRPMNSHTVDMTLARFRLEHWQHERTSLRCGRVKNYAAPGRAPANPNTNRYDAALVRLAQLLDRARLL